jgi:lipid II:glycine glycyltransferase (peptidoglycan interpeptide bridge formation enzyme)
MINDLFVLKNSDIDTGKWMRFFIKNSFATPFQSVEYYNFINSIPGQKAEVFAVELSDEIQALCVITIQNEIGIKEYFSRRAIIYGGPLVIEGENGNSALEYMFNSINFALKSNVIYGEIRASIDFSHYKVCLVKYGWKYLPHLNVQIPLESRTVNEILKGMKYNRRREIKMTYNSGATTREANNIDEINELYGILNNLYYQRVKSPLPPLEFFQKLFLSSIGRVFLVIHENKVIGGTFCIQYDGISINTLYYCGIRDYNKKIFPTHLAIMAAIEFGIINKVKILDLMGAGKPNEKYGVRNYKTEFGGELVEYGRYHKIFNPVLFRLGYIGINILNKIRI